MNAIVNESRAVPPAAQPHPTHKLKWLLKREFWENKGGFFWAPLISGAVFLLFTLLGGGSGQFILNRNGAKVIDSTTYTDYSIEHDSVTLHVLLKSGVGVV